MSENDEAGGWLDAKAAAERLGVKPATLYAYVSRGVLRRRQAPDGRRSLFDAAQVEDLARRGKPRRPPGPGELAIESAITALGADRPFYRGRDVLGLAEARAFEDVAGWLWTGRDEAGETWRAHAGGVAAAGAAQSGLPPDLLPLDRLQLIVTALAATDPLRHHLDPDGVIATGRALIAGLVEALPAANRAPDTGRIAERLWNRLCPHPPRDGGLLRALEAAMILLADHELAASTVAARVAASVRADPYAVVASGLGVLSGPLHGGASYGAERLIAEVGDPASASRVVGERLRGGERIPGFGHVVYKSGDGRAALLLDLVRAAAPGHGRLAAAEAVLAETARRRLPTANIDFAVAALGAVAGFVPGAGEAVFAVARTAGWLAHALEEYGRRSPLRPRAVYVGPPPG
ncbi:helix-turn-helix domain-containing protein [Actinomadura darangshiensis]|uniref:citrate synthase (unknown stereospecificity) n=1 Tax=Actinomadura darangshiensis TaxID=705336 RepID=A0A4R5B3Y9_9ACTN|nr:citrate/2-methylcitrate synthase [Actinomadura darangshiensis]TDD79935.1 helix-turn-helix domain-containing protein [Actinomadura darangshiensis]